VKSICPECETLTLKFSVASAKVYGLASEQAEATKRRDSNLGRFSPMLRVARAEAREAEKALGEHSKQHGCEMGSEPKE
jgi:hypothetical protein